MDEDLTITTKTLSTINKINSHHSNEICSYLKFCKQLRNQSLRSVKNCFADAKNTRLNDETFTKEEVEDVLESICSTIFDEIEGELLHSSHSNSVILSSLFQQAEKWHLNLQVDVASAENQENLSFVRLLEESGNFEKRKSSQLAPLQSDPSLGPSALLQAKIQELTTEKANLQQALHELNEKVKNLSIEKENINLDMNFAKKEIEQLKNNLQDRPMKADVSQLNKEVNTMRTKLSSKEEENDHILKEKESDLADTRTSLQQARSQLQLAEKELEKRFAETSAYQNMKKLLVKKNERIKALHQKLLKYEPEDDILQLQMNA